MSIDEQLKREGFQIANDGDELFFRLSHRAKVRVVGFGPVYAGLLATKHTDPGKVVRRMLRTATMTGGQRLKEAMGRADRILAIDRTAKVTFTLRINRVWWPEPKT